MEGEHFIFRIQKVKSNVLFNYLYVFESLMHQACCYIYILIARVEFTKTAQALSA